MSLINVQQNLINFGNFSLPTCHFHLHKWKKFLPTCDFHLIRKWKGLAYTFIPSYTFIRDTKVLIRNVIIWPQEKHSNSVLIFYSFPVVKRKRQWFSKKFLANICQKGSALSKNFRGFFSIDHTISHWCGIVQTLH